MTPELAARTLSSVGTQAAKRALSQKRALKTENTKSLTCKSFSDDIFFREGHLKWAKKFYHQN